MVIAESKLRYVIVMSRGEGVDSQSSCMGLGYYISGETEFAS
jgi:hypothetical protein